MRPMILDDYISSDAERRQRAVRAVGSGFGAKGYVPIQLSKADWRAYANARRFFFDDLYAYMTQDRASLERDVLPIRDSWSQRGLALENTEASVSGAERDWKRWYFANVALDQVSRKARAEYPQYHQPNYWPKWYGGCAEFRDIYITYGRMMRKIARMVTKAAFEAAGIDPALADVWTVDAFDNFRGLYYLALTEELVGTVDWGGHHTDLNCVTVLGGGQWIDPDGNPRDACPDERAGLHLITRDDVLEQAVAPKYCVQAQVGQMLEILTGGTFIATSHTVVPPRVPGWSRLAAAYFGSLNGDVLLKPLPPHDTRKAVRYYGPPVTTAVHTYTTVQQIGISGMRPEEMFGLFGYSGYGRLRRQYAKLGL